MKTVKVTLLPQNQVIDVQEGESFLHAAKRQGVCIKSTCGGVASCRTCIIKVIDGEKHATEMTFEEQQLLGNVFHITRERLSCQLQCTGDMTIDISEHGNAKLQDMGSKTLK